MPVSITPTVRAIVEAIRQKISDGSYVRGEQLPAEMELSTRLGVSRGSVRRAIEVLVEDGDLIRRMHSRPVVSGGAHRGPLPGQTDILVWVAQTVADESSLPFIQGISRGLSGTPYRMVVREPSLNMGAIIQIDEKRFLTELPRESTVAGAIIWRDAFADNVEEFRQVLARQSPVVFVDSPAPGGLQLEQEVIGQVEHAGQTGVVREDGLDRPVKVGPAVRQLNGTAFRDVRQ
jgi:DNA-binding transcriptional regulator YhcF (GntR family)